MGAVKDLIDLVARISCTAEDSKLASELREIQSISGSIQSEHAAIHEQRIELMTENVELKQDIISLREEILRLKQEAFEFTRRQERGNEKLSEDAEKVLVNIIEAPKSTCDQIADKIKRDIVETEHCLHLLRENKLISALNDEESAARYYIVQKGRKYLMANGLI